MTKISIIVPAYNVEPYLKRCIDSILGQTFTDFELILIDDGSPDNCGNICDEYAGKDNRVFVIHQANGGRSLARNRGIEQSALNSDSEWITFIDADDWVHKRYLEILFNEAIKNNANISGCSFKRVSGYEKDNAIDLYRTLFGSTQKLLKKAHNFDVFNTSSVCAKLYKKELFENIRFPEGRYFEDEYVAYKLLCKTEKIVVINKDLYYYFQHNDSIMHSPMSVKKIKDQFDSLEEQLHFYYKNKLKLLFRSTFIVYLSFFEKYISRFTDDLYAQELAIRKGNLIELQNKYHSFLPLFVKIYGCNEKTVCIYNKIDRIKNDFFCVKEQYNLVFALLYTIKHFLSNKL